MTTIPRFTAMSVPGDAIDGSDTGWHVYDHKNRTSRKVGNGPDAESKAVSVAKALNASGAPKPR